MDGGMRQFEYKFASVALADNPVSARADILERLNAEGQDGWVVADSGDHDGRKIYLLAREIPPQAGQGAL